MLNCSLRDRFYSERQASSNIQTCGIDNLITKTIPSPNSLPSQAADKGKKNSKIKKIKKWNIPVPPFLFRQRKNGACAEDVGPHVFTQWREIAASSDLVSALFIYRPTRRGHATNRFVGLFKFTQDQFSFWFLKIVVFFFLLRPLFIYFFLVRDFLHFYYVCKIGNFRGTLQKYISRAFDIPLIGIMQTSFTPCFELLSFYGREQENLLRDIKTWFGATLTLNKSEIFQSC